VIHWFQSAGSSHAFTVLEGGPLIYALVLFEGIELDGQPFRVRAR
jgi:hypothetical protein